jgi:hypothetical protein
VQVSFRGLVRTPVAVAVVLAAVGGCGDRREAPRDGLAADTARFTWDTRSAEVPLTACGRDGDVVALAGVRGDIVIQAEVDLGDGGSDRTGVTADLGGDGIMGAFGAEMEHGPAGEVTDVRLEGDRVIVEGTWVAFDDQLQADPGAVGGGIAGRLVARCPEDEDDEVAGLGPSAG